MLAPTRIAARSENRRSTPPPGAIAKLFCASKPYRRSSQPSFQGARKRHVAVVILQRQVAAGDFEPSRILGHSMFRRSHER
jgi:hypothetical protein